MYGQDVEFALFLLIGWVAFLMVAAVVELVIQIRNTTPRTYITPKWF